MCSSDLPFYWSRSTGNVATNADGSLIFVSAPSAIHVLARNTTTGDITYQGCVSDRGPETGNDLPPDCAGLATYYSNTAYAGQFAGTVTHWNMAASPSGSSGSAPIRMSVIGNDLYTGTQQRLLQFKIVPGSPTTLVFNACWRSDFEPGVVSDSCQVLRTPGMAVNGHLYFTDLSGPTVTPDGKNIYALVTTKGNIGQPDSAVSAILHFARNTVSGDLSYQDCAGQLQEVDNNLPTSVTFTLQPCGYGNLFGFRYEIGRAHV